MFSNNLYQKCRTQWNPKASFIKKNSYFKVLGPLDQAQCSSHKKYISQAFSNHLWKFCPTVVLNPGNLYVTSDVWWTWYLSLSKKKWTILPHLPQRKLTKNTNSLHTKTLILSKSARNTLYPTQHHIKAALLPQQTFKETLPIDLSASMNCASRTLKLPDMFTFFQIRKD